MVMIGGIALFLPFFISWYRGGSLASIVDYRPRHRRGGGRSIFLFGVRATELFASFQQLSSNRKKYV
jgi:hypothetical protein